MYNVPIITVRPIYDATKTIIGTEYLDEDLYVDCEALDPVDAFCQSIEYNIGKKESVILYRQDIKRFADLVESKHSTSKSIFKQIKCRLRAKYTVFKLRHNPRTLEWNGLNIAFIVHINSHDKQQIQQTDLAQQ